MSQETRTFTALMIFTLLGVFLGIWASYKSSRWELDTCAEYHNVYECEYKAVPKEMK